jgi:hypothetical protein
VAAGAGAVDFDEPFLEAFAAGFSAAADARGPDEAGAAAREVAFLDAGAAAFGLAGFATGFAFFVLD